MVSRGGASSAFDTAATTLTRRPFPSLPSKQLHAQLLSARVAQRSPRLETISGCRSSFSNYGTCLDLRAGLEHTRRGRRAHGHEPISCTSLRRRRSWCVFSLLQSTIGVSLTFRPRWSTTPRRRLASTGRARRTGVLSRTTETTSPFCRVPAPCSRGLGRKVEAVVRLPNRDHAGETRFGTRAAP